MSLTYPFLGFYSNEGDMVLLCGLQLYYQQQILVLFGKSCEVLAVAYITFNISFLSFVKVLWSYFKNQSQTLRMLFSVLVLNMI